MVDESCNLAKLKQVKRNGDRATNTFEFEALMMALTYIEKRVVSNTVNIITDSLEVKRFFNDNNNSLREWINGSLKGKCYQKLVKLSMIKDVKMTWVKRSQNIAGRVLEDCGKRKPKIREFKVDFKRCKFCNDVFTGKKKHDSHIYNRHVVFR